MGAVAVHERGEQRGVTLLELLEDWTGLLRAADFEFRSGGAVLVRGAGERQAIVGGEPVESATIEMRGARSTTGDGWGIVFHGSVADNGGISGYVFQMDTGYGGRTLRVA